MSYRLIKDSPKRKEKTHSLFLLSSAPWLFICAEAALMILSSESFLVNLSSHIIFSPLNFCQLLSNQKVKQQDAHYSGY